MCSRWYHDLKWRSIEYPPPPHAPFIYEMSYYTVNNYIENMYDSNIRIWIPIRLIKWQTKIPHTVATVPQFKDTYTWPLTFQDWDRQFSK